MNSIILPAYAPTAEVEYCTARCLHCLKLHTALPYELIVVENGSRSPVFEKYNKAAHLTFEHPLGFANAVNRGVEVAVGEYLFIINNDVFVPKNWDLEIINAYKNLPKGGGLLSPMDEPCEQRYYLDQSWWSCVCIRRDVWNKVGKLDDVQLNFRYHDQDWSIRARMMDYDVARWGGVRVSHQLSATYKHTVNPETEIAERTIMHERYGCDYYSQWVAKWHDA